MHKNKFKIFVDSANLKEIQSIDFVHIDGVTTNPSLAAKVATHKENRFEEYKKILSEIAYHIKGSISAEVIATDFDNMMLEALELREIANNITIKLPTTKDGLKACRVLSFDHNIDVNMTLCFSPSQAVLAALNGAKYISPFVGRLDDIGIDGLMLIEDIKTIYENYQFSTQILAASVRNINHIIEVMKIGVDVITMPVSLIEQMYKHVLTDKGLEIFLKDWNK
jgi:transaldolase